MVGSSAPICPDFSANDSSSTTLFADRPRPPVLVRVLKIILDPQTVSMHSDPFAWTIRAVFGRSRSELRISPSMWNWASCEVTYSCADHTTSGSSNK